MKYALFLGCTFQTEQYGSELSVREVLPRLGVELVDLDGASCCGFPSFSITSPLCWTYLSARNLALAERLGLDILPLCNSCHLSFCEVKRDLDIDSEHKNLINQTLPIEGLEYSGKRGIVHLLEVLHDRVGVEKIVENVVNPLTNLKLAAHPGCHAFRPSNIERPDDRNNPKKLDELIRASGAEAMDYPEKTDCCGSHISMSKEKASFLIAGSKLRTLRERGFDGLVTTCPHCFKIFDGKQLFIQSLTGDDTISVPVVYYTQLLGLALGIHPEKLGLHLNLSPVEQLLTKVEGDVLKRI